MSSSGHGEAEIRFQRQISVLKSWMNTEDRPARTAPGRRAMQKRFENQVDPDGVLDPEERRRRAETARKLHMSKMGLASVKARRLRREAAAAEQKAKDFEAELGGGAA